MNLIDFHIHSTFSDGNHSPAELTQKAHGLGLSAISLTDHDTVDGIDQFKKTAAKYGIRTITGIELSAWYQERSMHILGYGFNHRNPAFIDGLKTIQWAREERNNGILEKLNDLGIIIASGDLDDIAVGQIGRPHFAQILYKKGLVNNRDEAFGRFLGLKGKAYVARKNFPAHEAINMIKAAGGAAILAHPGNLDPNFYFLPELIVSLKKIGLDGIEAFHPSHTSYMANKLLSFGRKEGLMLTCGTDYHANPAWESLLARLPVPDSLQKDLLNRLDMFHKKNSA